MVKLKINYFDFKEKVQYKCPYNKYIHYWCVPVVIFSDDIKSWIKRCLISYEEMYLDYEWIKKFHPVKVKDKLSYTKIQRGMRVPKCKRVHPAPIRDQVILTISKPIR